MGEDVLIEWREIVSAAINAGKLICNHIRELLGRELLVGALLL
jgi:hypothetical protein